MSLSQQYFERSLQVAPGGVHSPVRAFKSVGGQPLFFKSAQGAYLTDVDGKSYVDFCMSFGPLLLGHRHPEVQAEVEKMIRTAWSFGTCEPYSLQLAEWIKEQVPFVEKIRFTSSGTEAVMSALRVARAATGRKKILKFNGCYHGHVDNLLVKAGSGLAGQSSSDSAGVPEAWVNDTLVCDLNDSVSLENIFSEQGGEIAAVIIEPLPANYGLLTQREDFLRQVQGLTQKAGSLLILDEVISGFRVGPQGMAGHLDICPDLVCYGKVVGGGFPVGAYGGRADLLDWVAPQGPVYQAGTLSANPIGMTAGLKTLQLAVKKNIWQDLAMRANAWKSQLHAEWKKREVPLHMSVFGSLFWIHRETEGPVRSINEIPPGHSEFFKPFFHALRERGVYLAPSGYEVGFLSDAHDADLLASLVPIFGEAAQLAWGQRV